MRWIQIRGPLPVEGGPLCVEISGDLLKIVGHDLPRRDLHDGGHSHPWLVSPWPCFVGVLELRNLQDGVQPVLVEVESPTIRVVHRTADAHRQ